MFIKLRKKLGLICSVRTITRARRIYTSKQISDKNEIVMFCHIKRVLHMEKELIPELIPYDNIELINNKVTIVFNILKQKCFDIITKEYVRLICSGHTVGIYDKVEGKVMLIILTSKYKKINGVYPLFACKNTKGENLYFYPDNVKSFSKDLDISLILGPDKRLYNVNRSEGIGKYIIEKEEKQLEFENV